MAESIQLDRFVPPHDPVLARVAHTVELSELRSPDIQRFIDEMFKIAYGEQKDSGKPLLVGLAAPQIGISKRIILVDVLADVVTRTVGDLRLYVNPEITSYSDEQNEWYEGCFSTSDQISKRSDHSGAM